MSIGSLTGSFTGTGTSASIGVSNRKITVRLSGFGTGTVKTQRSFDGGTTWEDVKSYTADAVEVVEEPGVDVLWRFNCSAHSSGTLAYRLSY